MEHGSRRLDDVVAAASDLLRTGRVEEAFASFREVLGRDPHHLEARRGVARSLLRLGDLGAARDHYLQLLEGSPDDVEGLTGLGIVALKSGVPEVAIDRLRAAQRVRPGHTSSAVKLSEALVAVGRSDESLEVLMCARRRHPDSSRLRVALARLHLSRASPELAEQELVALGAMPRGDRSETYAAARAWMELGRHDRAIPLLEALLEAEGVRRDDAAEVGMLEALLALRQWERALAFAETAAPRALRSIGTALPGPRAERVPALIHQYWEPGDMPDEYRVRSEEWGRRNPECVHRVWSASEAEALLADLSGDAQRAFRSLRHPAMRSDLFRYAVLLRHGGVYLDANLTAALPLHLTVLATPGFHATAGKNSVGRPLERMSIRNDFIASPPEHPIVLAALMTSVRNVLDRSAPNLISLAGPPVLSEAFRAVVRGGERGAGTLHVWETLRAQCLRGSLPRPAGQDESHWTRLSFEAGFVEG